MALEDEINARLRHLSEEIRAFRENIDQLRKRDSRKSLGNAENIGRDKTAAVHPAPITDPGQRRNE
jgi:hypothetical protein